MSEQNKISPEFLFGMRNDFLMEISSNIFIHRDLLTAYRSLQEKAQAAGFALEIASGFRSYERQLFIWNDKITGKRPIWDDLGNILDPKKLNDEELIFAILRWSAIPGTSRHHWGSDLDVFNRKAMPENYQLQLSAAEVSAGGIFADFHNWLDDLIDNGKACDFFRPYNFDLGGTHPEKWHISYAPLADRCYESFDLELFEQLLQQYPFPKSNIVEQNAIEIFNRFLSI
ncbi:MAG: hypothetical protein A2504_12760 [Bdellovibrionales bacterium RIFOXYD12_FULL_39_22]|nr:MAG: hypothetical protein A2385_03845 [Bdellovibrionales bacterium RIFOXYB1_FULL_39_21]OFZ40485.1 MAG: hypothetical protein A2485_02710 [Bdellovibrionales bacterium RIFOXYC12_FULL_39_17]OFZ49968.1 MAG: hypothetical protein A2404_02045 [Bdellovibrionales bacterium RIFOXYC1_FULL_39_130]OFZ74076.1 MAG: hypothetical protein A2451_07445 [Bdellovibrionales bacterium RIFOXYC2_FULL_39_8]OFZ77610.1 MAG: hypothetical protein A2560_04605 [Bdellovibrionales bacterium RIFOXYD1_FULL_39_84]OFZ96064.1 MAG: